LPFYFAHDTGAEESFLRRRNELSIRIFECIWTTQLCYDIRGAMSTKVESRSGELRADTVLNQQILETWTYDTPKGAVTLNITIGHTGPNWQPFITVTTSDGFSERFLDTASRTTWANLSASIATHPRLSPTLLNPFRNAQIAYLCPAARLFAG
jgi:hypothetical protein